MPSNSVEKAIDFFLEELGAHKKITVAFSGGKDSTVLLHCLLQKISSSRLNAIYINHQLQSNADSWGVFCRKFCEEHNVRFEEKRIDIKDTNRKGIEAVAREERYRALFASTSEDGVLVTAHHLQDQAETILFNLFRGTGLAGLSAMRFRKDRLFDNKSLMHYRPLLSVRLPEIIEYLHQHQLNWIEDDSNEDQRFSRNFIRNALLPLISKKWPKFDISLWQMSATVSEALTLLDELAEQDFAKVESSSFSLDLARVVNLGWPRQKNLIRYWVSHYVEGFELNRSIYDWLKENLYLNNANAHPSRKLSQASQIRVEGYKIYVLNGFHESFEESGFPDDIEILHFDEREFLSHTVADHWMNESVVFRSVKKKDFEVFPGLKKWLKEQNVVYWNRSRWPVVEINGEVAAVLGYFTYDKFKY